MVVGPVGATGEGRPSAVPATAGPPNALAETCRVVGLAIPLWPYHRERLRVGGCSDALLLRVEHAVEAAVADYGGRRTSRLRLHLVVGTDGSVTVEVARALSSLDVVGGPVLASVRLAELPPMPALPSGAAKPGDRSWWDAAARAARRSGAHQAVIVDDRGRVIDGSSATIWLASGRTLVTPPSPPAIAGVGRALVLKRAGEIGLTAGVEPMLLTDVAAADEVLLTNAFGGAVSVRGRGGPLSDAVRALFADEFAGGSGPGAGV